PPLYLFFSQGHRARRALPSFPTRRSSDLSISESSRPCIGRWPPNWSFVSLQEHPPEGACAGLIFLCCASMITCPHMGIIRHFRSFRNLGIAKSVCAVIHCNRGEVYITGRGQNENGNP